MSEEAVGFRLMLSAIQSCGNPGVPLPQGPPFFRFSEPAECERTLQDAGFLDVKGASIPQLWRFDTPDGLFDAIYGGGVRIKAILRAQSEEALHAIRAALREALGKYRANGSIELPMPSILVSATFRA